MFPFRERYSFAQLLKETANAIDVREEEETKKLMPIGLYPTDLLRVARSG